MGARSFWFSSDRYRSEKTMVCSLGSIGNLEYVYNIFIVLLNEGGWRGGTLNNHYYYGDYFIFITKGYNNCVWLKQTSMYTN